MVGRLCVPKVLAETPAGTQVRKAAKKSVILAEEKGGGGGTLRYACPGVAWRVAASALLGECEIVR